jgi:CubicO group peptidase (beta-lactamase class C family)
MAAAAERKGSPARFWCDGERRIGTGIAVQENDLWHLGSITKSMTSSLVARLVDAGSLRWDDTVGGMLGDVVPNMNEAYRPATFRHLLSHRSGLPANIPVPDLAKFARELADAREERKAYARIALAQQPNGPIAAKFEYSNSGYVVAGAMLEARLGKSWETLTRTHLFEPMNLASAGFGAPGHAGVADQPAGHARTSRDSGLVAHPAGAPITDNPVVIGPAGRVHMNLADVMRYLAAHRDESSYLKAESWRLLHTPPFGGDYAMGWIVRKDGVIWHNGSNTLWYAEVMANKAAGTIAAAATNDGDLASVTPVIGKVLRQAEAAV